MVPVHRAVLALAASAALAACSSGRPAPGFTLTDDTGHAWTLAGQRGTSVLLTFGFTHCTDTCPATLAKLARLVGDLGTKRNAVEIAFVTVDPQRDSPLVLHRYLVRFAGARMVGLTGTPSQIDDVETAYHVWAQRIPGTRGSDDYNEAHSAVIFFIDASGRVQALHDDDDSSTVLAAAVRRLVG